MYVATGARTRRNQEWSTFGLRYGHPLTSSYPLPAGQQLVITTGVDRATTRVLLDAEWADREVDVRTGYAQWAPVYDVEQNPLIAIEAPRVAALLATLPMTQVLDVGAGTGRHALALARRGVTVTAFDQSPEMLTQAQHVAAQEGLAITFQHGMIEDGLPFRDGTFDLVLCALMLSHVTDLAPVVAEFARVLGAGGHLLITDFHPRCIGSGLAPGALLSRHDLSAAQSRIHPCRLPGGGPDGGLHAPAHPRCATARSAPSHFPDSMRRDHGAKPFCLIILAQKPDAEAAP